jgi:DNA/RNA endonuclease YhcR with UshA esterase domain
VQDTSGDMRVLAYRTTVQALLVARRIPMPGDVVTVEGTLRVRDDEPSLVLNAPEALDLHTPEATTIELTALDAMQIGERARVHGQVRRMRHAGDGLQIMTLRDGNAEADVLLPQNLQPIFGAAPVPQVGQWVSVAGGVGEYHGKRQLLPSRAADLTPSAVHEPETRPIGVLNKDLLGQWVAVRGTVDKLRPIKGGMLIDLRENGANSGANSGAITVAMFESWFGVPFSPTLRIGNTVIALGELVEYRGQLELQPELSVDLMLDK